MIALQTSRAIKFAIQNFRRNLWLSIVTIIIVAVAVFSISLVSALNVLGGRALQTVEKKVDVTLELKTDVTEDQALAFKGRLEALPNIQSIVYQSKTQAFENFKQIHKDDPNIQALLAELTENPLPANIIIKAKKITDFEQIMKFVDIDENIKLIADKDRDFQDSQTVITKLTQITDRIREIGILVSGVFALLSLIVLFNTIRIAIYTHREEIGIMRLVGASNGFIRSPFIIESIIYSIIGAGIALAVIIVLWQSAAPAVYRFFFVGTDVSVSNILKQEFWAILGWEFIGAIILSTLSAWIAARRYLKV
ncbi:MAG: permease-like cell division protein FtsX [Patescibacteria group bacterium]|jgi:cell division transport system permease protein